MSNFPDDPPLDLADPLADLGALYAAAQDAHNRGDEFATVCMRLVERLAEVPITLQHQIEHLLAEVERLRAGLEEIVGEPWLMGGQARSSSACAALGRCPWSGWPATRWSRCRDPRPIRRTGTAAAIAHRPSPRMRPPGAGGRPHHHPGSPGSRDPIPHSRRRRAARPPRPRAGRQSNHAFRLTRR